MTPLWSAEVEARIRREAVNLDPQRPPETVQMCKRCVMTNQRPRIVFDEEGVCSACRYAERKKTEIDWAERERELRELLNMNVAGAYDVIVPSSGGKDSSFVASTLRDTYGQHVLCARWAPFMTTEIGERNWQALIHAGFDTVTGQPNGLLHRKLARLALEFVGDPFVPFIFGQLCYPLHVAVQNDVRLVFFGENGETLYGGDTAAENKPCWGSADWERVYMKGAGVDRIVQIGLDLGAIEPDEVKRVSPFYRLPEIDNPPEFHWTSYYLPWFPQENFYIAAEKTGFEPNEERSQGTYSRYASIDDKMDNVHYFFGYLKFGIGRCTSDAAHEIRDGELTREEGLSLVAKYDGEYPSRHLSECLDYLDMDKEQFGRVVERFDMARNGKAGLGNVALGPVRQGLARQA